MTLIIQISISFGNRRIPFVHKYAGICMEPFVKDVKEMGGEPSNQGERLPFQYIFFCTIWAFSICVYNQFK